MAAPAELLNFIPPLKEAFLALRQAAESSADLGEAD